MKRLGVLSVMATMAGFAAFASSAHAQGLTLNGNQANFGVHALRSGFTPDPKAVTVQSGGSVDSSTLNLGSGCRGFVTRQPDVVLNYTTSNAAQFLRFYVLGQGDTTLLINDARGRWFCNDDVVSGNTNPQVDIQGAPSGHYDIWIGSYRSGERVNGTLNITELQSNGAGAAGAQAQAAASGNTAGVRACGQTIGGRPACVDANAPQANFGCRGRGRACSVHTGFTPDPWVFRLSAGGGRDPINVESLNLSDSQSNERCGRSYITPRPDFRFNFEAGSRFELLRMYVQTQNGADATLLVNTPDGRWRCNDDSHNTRMPTIDFHNPSPGRYDVWVGTYDASSRNPATFNVTELDSNHP